MRGIQALRVFLSYRRDDASGHAGRLHDALTERFGDRRVFQDVDAIEAGTDFVSATYQALESSEAALIVIGPRWLEARTAGGARRLDDPEDLVRLEVAAALRKSPRVVPVLVGGAELPTADELPEEVRGLVERQAFELRDTSWSQDFEQLMESLSPRRLRPRWLVPAVAGAVVALVAVIVWQVSRGGDEDAVAELAVCPDPAGELFTPLAIRVGETGTLPMPPSTLTFAVSSGGYRQLSPGVWQVVLNTTMTNDTPQDESHAHWHYDGFAVEGRQFPTTCSSVESVVASGRVDDGRIGFDVTLDPQDKNLILILDGDEIDLTP